MTRGLACLALLGLACGPKFRDVDVTLVEVLGDVSHEVRAAEEEIVLPAGLAILVRLVPDSARAAEFEAEDVVFTGEDDGVFALYREDELWEYVLIGNAAGEACITVEVRGVDEGCIPVRVLE